MGNKPGAKGKEHRAWSIGHGVWSEEIGEKWSFGIIGMVG